MRTRTLARARLDGAGWAHPYTDPFVCYADGGDGDASVSDNDGTATGDGPPAAAPPSSSQSTGPADNGQDVSALPDWAQKVIRDAREEAGKARTVAKANAAAEARQQMAQDIGKALGLVEGDKAPTPEELTQQLRESHGQITAAQEDAAAARLELHVYRTASRLGANAEALLDSRTFCDTIDNIDPSGSAEAFNAQVEKAITTALEGNPQLRTGQAPQRGGGEFAGGPGTTGRPTSLGQAVAAGLGG